MSTMGECPHENCRETVWRIIPDGQMPRFSDELCPECGQHVWMYYSRVDPCCYTPEQFHERYEVDEASKSIRLKTFALQPKV